MEKPLAKLAAETTSDNPWPLRLLSQKMKGYIERMSPVWIEGEVVELSMRPGKLSFLKLRDLEEEASLSVALWPSAIAEVADQLKQGARVVVHARPTFWERSGSLQMQGSTIQVSGTGDMLARIERLRRELAARGIFDKDQKRPLPFLPRRIGLVCGQGAKAEQDVLVNARKRWPGAQFETRYANVQGPHCPPTVSAAITELDAIEDIDVIIVTRGGGAVEDLLGFSDERIVMAAYNATTPIVSAIGHETDCPLLDLVADYRASTPTDAARHVVPDLQDELEGLAATIDRARALLSRRIDTELQNLHSLLTRPSLASPTGIIDAQIAEVETHRRTITERISKRLEVESARLEGLKAQLKALSPTDILQRGYAVLRKPDKSVITDASEVKKGDLVEAMLAQGSLVATVFGVQPQNLSRQQ